MLDISAIIVDDEPAAIQILQIELERVGNIKILKSITDPRDTVNAIINLKPDIVFLDVQMPEKNGIDILKEIANQDLECYVVMVTAFSDFMLDAFRNAAFDYLQKPVDREQLKEVIIRYAEKKTKETIKERVNTLLNSITQKVRIPSTYETYYFDPGQIFYFHADGKYTDIYLVTGKKITSSLNLGAIEELLQSGSFERISKSYIINTEYLSKVNRSKKICTISCPEIEIDIPYSKSYKSLFNLF
jgi:two-component system LytT family response regulator